MGDSANGLEKKLTPLSVWALAFGCIIGWGAFVMPGDTFLVNAGPLGTAIAMVIAAVVMIVIALNYGFMIKLIPVAGGEFAYAQNAFGKTSGFVCSWFLALSYLSIVPLNATALALIGRNLFENVFQFGYLYEVAGYDVYLGEILLAVVALVLFAFLSIRGVESAGIFQTGLTISLVLSVVVILIAALISPKTSIDTLVPAYYPGIGSLEGVLAIVAVAPWAFVGFDTVPQAAEEYNFSPAKSKLIMVFSIIFGAGVYIVLNTVTAAVFPERYASWVEYLDDLPNLSGLESLPTFNAANELLGTTGMILIIVAVLAAILSGIIGFYMATSRLLFSMSKEKVIPSWFGELDSKYKTPRNALLFTMAISIIAPSFGRTVLSWVVDMSSIGAAIGYGFTSAAALKYALKEKNTGVIITGTLGVLFSLLFSFLLLVPVEGFNSSLGKESYICLCVWVLLGIFFFVGTKKKR